MRAWFIGWLLALSAVTLAYQGGSPESASIEGRVVAQTTGSPLKNAIVRLRLMPESPGEIVDRQLVQQTNEEGRFVFANVPGGDWELSADKRGFVPRKYGARKYDPQGSRISVRRDEQIRDLVLKLVPRAVIAGRVLDVEGEPVEGARVALLKAGYTNGAPRSSEVASAVTLDNGEYRIPRVTAGRYLVRCGVARVDSSGIETTYAATYYPNVTEPSLAAAIDVRDDGGEISGLDMRLAPVRVFHVRARFLPPSGGQSDAAVFLVERSDPSKIFASSSARPPEYPIDFPRIPPGSYIVYAWSMHGSGEFRASQPVEVKAQDVEILLLSAAAGEIRGSVNLKPAGRQIDLSKLSVEIRPIRLEMGGGYAVPSAVKIGDDLKFRYPLLHSPQFASFQVSVPNLPEGSYMASVQYGGKDVTDSEIEYSTSVALEITIRSDGARVEGKTLDKDDNPWDGAVVALIPANGKGATRSVKSGAGGAFQITGVPPGEYKLPAWDDAGQDDLQNPDFVKRFESQATAVKLDASGAAAASIRVIAQETVR